VLQEIRKTVNLLNQFSSLHQIPEKVHLHLDPFLFEMRKINKLLMKSMDWAEVELLCLNKIKLNHFVIVSMMKHSEIYWITWRQKKGDESGEGKSDKWVCNKVELISSSLLFGPRFPKKLPSTLSPIYLRWWNVMRL
jgi:hypothetical protein